MVKRQEIYDLSPNGDLFSFLEGKSIEQPSKTSKSAGDANNLYDLMRTELWDVIVTKAKSSYHLFQIFDQQESEKARVQVFGECVLACIACANNNNTNTDITPAILAAFFYHSVIFLSFHERLSEPDSERALREWIVLLTEHCDFDDAEFLLLLRILQGLVTSMNRPGLVGDSFLALGRAAKSKGDLAEAKRCFMGVQQDMKGNLVNNEPSLRFETMAIRHCYIAACEELLSIMDGDDQNAIQQDLDLAQLRFSNDDEEATFEPRGAMFGPLAATYLDRQAYLGKLLSEIMETDNLTNVCFRYDYCHEIDTLLFAIEKYKIMAMTGCTIICPQPMAEEALDALKVLYGEPGQSD